MSGRQELPEARTELAAPRAAGVAGLLFAVLLVVSLLLARRHPEPGSTAEEVVRWYLDTNASRVGLVGLYLVPFAGIAFLWFMAVLRAHFGEHDDRFFGTVLVGSGLLFVALTFAAAASAGSLLAAVEYSDAPAPGVDAVATVRALSYTLFYVYALRAAAVFAAVTSTIGLRSGRLPRWLGLAGYAVAAVLLLSVSFSSLLALLFPAWVAALSLVILVRTSRPGHRAVR